MAARAAAAMGAVARAARKVVEGVAVSVAPGAARVEAEGGRGAAQPANERRSDKVDVIDEALARVTDRLDALRDAE